jgi:hypothetical protein
MTIESPCTNFSSPKQTSLGQQRMYRKDQQSTHFLFPWQARIVYRLNAAAGKIGNSLNVSLRSLGGYEYYVLPPHGSLSTPTSAAFKATTKGRLVQVMFLCSLPPPKARILLHMSASALLFATKSRTLTKMSDVQNCFACLCVSLSAVQKGANTASCSVALFHCPVCASKVTRKSAVQLMMTFASDGSSNFA